MEKCLAEYYERSFPNQPCYLGNWLKAYTTTMIYGSRGTGKTWVAMSIAWAAGGKRGFLTFGPGDTQAKVLYINSELTARTVQQRFLELGKKWDSDVDDRVNIHILSPEDLPSSMDQVTPNMADESNLGFWDARIAPYDVIILDNITGLIQRCGYENEAETWIRMHRWINRWRNKGKAFVFIHHAGKSGEQRGTSVREDNLDFVIALKKPRGESLSATPGAHFELSFEKIREEWKPEFTPQFVHLEPQTFTWKHEPLKEKLIQQIDGLKFQGFSDAAICSLFSLTLGELKQLQTTDKKPIGMLNESESNGSDSWEF